MSQVASEGAIWKTAGPGGRKPTEECWLGVVAREGVSTVGAPWADVGLCDLGYD